MTEKTLHAIVLSRSDSGESDRRLTLLTQEEGVVSVIAKGARKAGSRLTGSSEPLSVSVIQVAPGKRNNFIRQSQPISSFPALRSDYDRLTLALSLCELASAILPHGKPAEDEFAFMLKAFKLFEVHEKPVVNYVWCQLKLLELSGFMPSFTLCAVSSDKISETPVFLSPHAGGYVSRGHAERFTDRFLARAEVLYGMQKTTLLDVPPHHLKFSEECAVTLFPFWKAITDRNLPASESVILELKGQLQNSL